jgi:hypothetical protein
VRTRFEHSAGGVVSRGAGEGLEVVLAARRRRSGELAWEREFLERAATVLRESGPLH